ncbi:hypothetical protein [Streptomyces sp. NRRL F-2664]|uniref:hypothetical protein n=1 Tax=Streptomyces sp. NRRL F-2664 TaxID=1463842 RepID=UPI0004CC0413|nr:hypothetical protein [Streptomyces sp. NRRL F-2664]
MTHTVRTRRLAHFAAATAMAAGAVLVPTAAFAATPAAAAHAAVTDRGGPGKDHRDSWKKGGAWDKKRPGAGGGKGGTNDAGHQPEEPQWQCITAPCGPPGKGGPDHGKHHPKEPQWQCVKAPCGPPRAASDDGRTQAG